MANVGVHYGSCFLFGTVPDVPDNDAYSDIEHSVKSDAESIDKEGAAVSSFLQERTSRIMIILLGR